MKKIGIITLFALIGVLFLMGCKQPTNADTWTELTAENIEAEIGKYDGTFKGEVEADPLGSGENQKFTFFFKIIAADKTMGMLWGLEEQLDPNNIPQLPMNEVMISNKNQNLTVTGNGRNTLKLSLPVEGGQPVEVILTKQ